MLLQQENSMNDGTKRGGMVMSVVVKNDLVELAMSDGDGYTKMAVERANMADRVRCGDSVWWLEEDDVHAFWTDDRALVVDVVLSRIGTTNPYIPQF